MDIRYAAGLFDGEGWVRINVYEFKEGHRSYGATRYQMLAGINMCHWPVIHALQQAFGGSTPIAGRRLHPNHRTLYMWSISSQIAARFFRRALPYLIVKKDEVALALEFQDNVDRYKGKLGTRAGYPPHRDAVFAWRDDIAKQISALKHRRFDSSYYSMAPKT